MEFKTNAAPYVRSKKSTLQIMLILAIALVVVWACGIIYNFKLDGALAAANIEAPSYGIKAILNVVIAVVVALAGDAVISIIKQAKKGKVDFKQVLHFTIHNYSCVSAMIYALTLPAYTSMYIIIIGTLFATLICKAVFGGFGKNVFNPAAMARIFVALCFGSQLGVPEAISSLAKAGSELYTVDAVSGATITTAYNNVQGWLSTSTLVGKTVVQPDTLLNGLSIKDILVGSYVGALGETFTLVILVLGIVLAALKVINWRTPVFYLGTVALFSVVVSLIAGMNVGLYLIASLGLGGLMFGAIFMLTDPVTGPSSNYGKIIAAIFAGFLTVLIRIKGGYPEGVVYSIAMANAISPVIDSLCKAKTNEKKGLKYGFIAGFAAVAVLFTSLLGGSIVKANAKPTNAEEAQTSYLQEVYALDNGYSYKAATKKTAKVLDKYVFEVIGETEDAISGAWDIVDENGARHGAAYFVQDTYTIEKIAEGENWGSTDVTCVALIIVNEDATIAQITMLSKNGASTGGPYLDASNSTIGEFIGKGETNLPDAPISGLSYSPAFIKVLCLDAIAEYKA